MKNFYILMDEKKEGQDGTGSTQEKSPPAQPPGSTEPKAEGSELDEFGYQKETALDEQGKEVKVDDKKGKEQKPPEDKEVKDPASGYGVDQKPPAKEEPKKEDPPKEDANKLEFELDLKDLEEKESNKIKEFAKKHKLSKEAAQEYADNKKAEFASQKEQDDKILAEADKQRKQVKYNWQEELKSDKEFGGANYEHSVKQVEKVLEEFLPLTKKALTKGSGMLPPDVMRDLSKLAKKLYSGESLVQGDAVIPPKQDEPAENDPLAFYNNT